MTNNGKVIPDEFDNVRLDVQSMGVFAGSDPTFNLGDWVRWREACQIAGKILSPDDYKGHK